MITFDTGRRFDPTALGDYLELNWQEFGDQHGYPKAAVFMPLCGAKSRQHPIGKHYNAWHKPVLDLAVKADQCVAKKSAWHWITGGGGPQFPISGGESNVQAVHWVAINTDIHLKESVYRIAVCRSSRQVQT